ncbi:microtubule-associated protein RP/EB family member 1 [Ceratitis capitata]|uniref:microtubule-associated protein RP/EB family member 1 n=1 Tax=Ceratitis capitata TaxID=7213 RepID=UPI00032A10CE|nr:microtubule-associated protein RP/EB family member 1 [Ceratitis capitata]
MDFTLDGNLDEDFFGVLKRQNTNLDNLFGNETQRSTSDEKEESLKYQPTKQASTSSNANKSTSSSATITAQTWQTLLAKVVHAYKDRVPIGKVGVALLQSIENEYRIIIYKAKFNVLTTCSLHVELSQIHRKDNYLQFYDDALCCWSVYFDTIDNTEEFVRKLNEINIKISEDIAGEPQESISAPETGENQNEEPIAMSAPIISKPIERPTVTAAKPTKSTLITRMAKMGKELPKMKTPPHLESSADVTDSSDTETMFTPITHPITPRSSRIMTTAKLLPVSQISEYPTPNVNSSFETQFMQMMLSENRTQSSELRMNINRLESKVEKVIDKIDLLQASSSHKLNKEDELLTLEEKVLELKKENRRLRQTIEESNVNATNASWQKLMQMYSTELEEANLANVDSLERIVGDLLKQRTTMQEKLEQWEKELTEKSLLLKTHESQFNNNRDELANIIASKQQLEDELKTLQKVLSDKECLESDLRKQLIESNNEIQAEKQRYEESKERGGETQNLLQEFQAQNLALQKQLDVKSNAELGTQHTAEGSNLLHENGNTIEQQIETVLKKTMNNLYASLAAKLENIVPMQKHAVVAIVGKTIREETLKAMESLE